MTKILAIVTLVLTIITVGCGFAIHFGGEPFESAVKGHLVLAILTLLSAVALAVNVLVK